MSQQSGVERIPSGLGWPEKNGAGVRPGSLAALAEVGLGDVHPAGVFDARWEPEGAGSEGAGSEGAGSE